MTVPLRRPPSGIALEDASRETAAREARPKLPARQAGATGSPWDAARLSSAMHSFERESGDMRAFSRVAAAITSSLCLLVGGCAAPGQPDAKEPSSRVIVYREPSTRDSIFPMIFAIDGRPVARLYPKEIVSIEISPGEHSFAYELDVYQCSARVRLEAGEEAVYRLAQGCIIEPGKPTIESSALEPAATNKGAAGAGHDDKGDR